MRRVVCCSFAIFLSVLGSTVEAATFRFDDVPFAGTNVLTTPGRQVVGGEDFLSFAIGADVYSLDPAAFGVNGPVSFVNDVAAGVPSGGVNVVVLQSFDDDANALTPFGAGNAANLIADQISTPGAGFFIYFNQGLDLPRLVFSTDLSDRNADLQILARMLNLTGQSGRNQIPNFTAANFDISPTTVPEPSTLSMIALGMFGAGRRMWRRKKA
jgi:hypothetical protein